jgi:hypothetical protein
LTVPWIPPITTTTSRFRINVVFLERPWGEEDNFHLRRLRQQSPEPGSIQQWTVVSNPRRSAPWPKSLIQLSWRMKLYMSPTSPSARWYRESVMVQPRGAECRLFKLRTSALILTHYPRINLEGFRQQATGTPLQNVYSCDHAVKVTIQWIAWWLRSRIRALKTTWAKV